MKRLIASVGVATLLIACGGSEASPSPSPGDAAVYARIAAETDCATLQAEFDTAAANHDAAPSGSRARAASLSYMEAAQARMKELKC